MNDVNVTTDPNNPAIDAVVYVNVDVFGSIRSRFDTVVYNKETVQVQTVLEVMAVNPTDRSLIMAPQVGAYEATYDEKYVGWVGPFNKKEKRITHSQLDEGLLISFEDLAKEKAQRDQEKHATFQALASTNTATIQSLESEYRQILQVRQQEQEIQALRDQIDLLKHASLNEINQAAQTQQDLNQPQSNQILAPSEIGQTSSAQYLNSVNADNYTIQLLAGTDKQATDQFIIENNLQPNAHTILTLREAGPTYIVLYGDYATLEQAQVVAASFTEKVKKNKPWVRQFKQIQAAFKPVTSQ